MATSDGSLRAVFGTMGGDAQPQILLQVAARLFHYGQSPAAAVYAGRWALRGPSTGFDTWTSGEAPTVTVEGHAPDDWIDGLADVATRSHRDRRTTAASGTLTRSSIEPDGFRAGGGADPRTMVGSRRAGI